jgi:hypothetical protein
MCINKLYHFLNATSQGFIGLARDCCGRLNKNASEPTIAARVGFDNPRYVAE